MKPVLIGYFPKRAVRRGDRLPSDAPSPFPLAEIDEIASVSGCIAHEPQRWTEQLTPNEFWGFADPPSAWEAVFPEDRPGLVLFAYKLFPARFVDGRQEPLEMPELAIEPLPDSFLRLGWDAVEIRGHVHGYHFGCSPLSCNHQANLPHAAPINRHCLAESEEQGIALARRFSISKPEPGPYCAVEVWREA